MEEFIRNQLITVYSSRIIGEFKTFIWSNNKAQAMRSYNDDLVMAFAIACWVRDTALTVNQRDMEYNKAIMSSMIVSSKQIDTTIPGMTGHSNKSKMDNLKNQARQEQDEFVWLLKG